MSWKGYSARNGTWLSPGELATLYCVSRGWSRPETAARLGVGVKTVDGFLQKVKNRGHMTGWQARYMAIVGGELVQNLHR